MMQISKVVGLEVLSKSDIKSCGVIKSVFFDAFCKKIVYFVVESGIGLYALPINAVRAVKDAAIVDDLTETVALCDIDVTSFCELMGKRVFTSDGDCKGEVNDVVLDDKGRFAFVIVGDGEKLVCPIAGVGDFILIKDASKKQKPKTIRMPKAEFDTPVYAHDEADFEGAENIENKPLIASLIENKEIQLNLPQVNKEPPPIKIAESLRGIELVEEEDHIPPRIICDYNFLLSRTLMTDLLSYTGELLASKGAPVTVDLVEAARRHGKLIDLTLSSK